MIINTTLKNVLHLTLLNYIFNQQIQLPTLIDRTDPHSKEIFSAVQVSYTLSKWAQVPAGLNFCCKIAGEPFFRLSKVSHRPIQVLQYKLLQWIKKLVFAVLLFKKFLPAG